MLNARRVVRPCIKFKRIKHFGIVALFSSMHRVKKGKQKRKGEEKCAAAVWPISRPTVSPYPHQIDTSIHSSSLADWHQQASRQQVLLPRSSPATPCALPPLLACSSPTTPLLRLGYARQQQAEAPGLTHKMDGGDYWSHLHAWWKWQPLGARVVA
jgi:hypothetical protein